MSADVYYLPTTTSPLARLYLPKQGVSGEQKLPFMGPRYTVQIILIGWVKYPWKYILGPMRVVPSGRIECHGFQSNKYA